MKIFFRNIHLYLSLAAGLVIMIACITGAILVFEKELEESFHPERYQVSATGERLALAKLIKEAKAHLPGAKVAGLKVYTDPERSVEIGLIAKEDRSKQRDKNKSVKGKKDEGKQERGPARPTHTAFLDPYTGKVIELYSPKGSFFSKTMALHRWLLGSNGGIGKYIVGVSTFLFLFILITGIILWWPKTRRILIQRIKVKWDGNFKRLNHDLHLVLGFYSAIFLFIFAFTAMSWSFEWFNKGIYAITKTKPESQEPPKSVFVKQAETVELDKAVASVMKLAGESVYFNVRSPKDSSGVFSITALPKGAIETHTDTYFVDQYSGDVIGSLKYADKNAGQKMRSYVKPIHTSTIYGTPTKILGVIVCLLGFSFPITGVIMWINRRSSEKKRVKKQLA